ncbi:hypothetical protein ACFW3Z_19935 [Nocardiopsis alba]
MSLTAEPTGLAESVNLGDYRVTMTNDDGPAGRLPAPNATPTTKDLCV